MTKWSYGWIYLVKVEDEIQLTHIVEVLIQHFDEVMYSFKVAQVVVIYVDADAEVEPRIAPVNDLEVAKLDQQ